MSMKKNNQVNMQFVFASIDEMVPDNHLLRKIDKNVDFNFIYDLVKPYYSDKGRKSIDPVTLFKMEFINIIYGYNSMRRTCEEIQVNLAYRWFLNISIYDSVPNFSTWSQNYIRRFKDTDVFEKIFYNILSQIEKHHLIDSKVVFGDSTHIKANANKNKFHNQKIKIATKKYEEELLDEINNDRECTGHKLVDSLTPTEIIFDEETGEEIKVEKTKNIKVSDVDEEAGCFHKGDKEQCFAYSAQTFCDKNGFVLESKLVPGNIHDSTSFFEAYENLNNKFHSIKGVCLDAGYKTAPICHEIAKNNQKIYVPYTRPRTKKGYIKKYEFVYDEVYDVYICPNNKLLTYTNTNKEGYRNYKSDKRDCKDCPFKNQCTKSSQKIITRHLWQEDYEEADEFRHSDEWKKIYPHRKETIERVFADIKQKFNIRYTRLKGLKKNQNWLWLVLSCHNFKKMALKLG